MEDDLTSRVEKLEIALAHQNQTIDELNEIVRDQWERIDALTKASMRLRDRLTEVEEASAGPHENTRPPHY